ncbi:MAG: hypothetical protein AW12_03017 [Candidatus Accumulibacter sp. BA-94]|nr:MAG: hypothetical protein AW12_03017 [Candidatus Accumulibacter sp. BA-94]
MLLESGAAQRLNSSTNTRLAPLWTTNCGRSTAAGTATLSTATATLNGGLAVSGTAVAASA